MYTVYRHICPDGRVYVGTTGRNPVERWGAGHGYRTNKAFFECIVSVGWENIKHEILAEGLTKEHAHEMERRLILEHKSTDKRFGFNLSIGGAGGKFGYGKAVLCIETGDVYKMALDAEHETGINRMHIGACCRGERMTAGGFHWAFVTDTKADEKLKRRRKRNQYKNGRVVCCDTGISFANCYVASEATGISRTGIYRACKGERKTAGGFRWAYEASLNEEE